MELTTDNSACVCLCEMSDRELYLSFFNADCRACFILIDYKKTGSRVGAVFFNNVIQPICCTKKKKKTLVFAAHVTSKIQLKLFSTGSLKERT